MDEEIFGEGGNTYPKARSCPNGRQHTDIKMSCRGTVVCMLTRTLINMKWLEHLTHTPYCWRHND
jgi:hypothetical protein